ncbi:diguanylate cyclase domain-containing protein [Pseudarthrobacter cellobiosi]|uniref:diguanylate cyclase domain-containing protein n=1 Tax=Pseudarthrobacter cellobiosi TaxID=2953654 RepID=UPI00208E4F77|nr:diguanylate cyclase [Pseudarthrobacter sp. HLT1-5]MCO4253794.1 diguanylate cyclase [Pseudarthrobacter sp. HLT1-5]
MKRATTTPRSFSLQREWSGAFTLMLLALFIGAAVTVVGVRFVVNEMEAATGRLQAEYGSVSELAAALETHEQLGYQLLAAAPVNREAFVLEQQDIEALFRAAAAVPVADEGRPEALSAAQQDWQAGLENGGLWGDQVLTLTGNNVADARAFAAASSKVRTQLAAVQQSSLQALNRGLVDTRELEGLLVIGRFGLFVVAIGATLYFRRRMVKDLMRPVNSLRRGVLKLQSGDYSHRLEVARRDELGEVAVAFNGMAAALQDSHKALTYRATHDDLTGLANRAALAERLLASFEPDSDRRTRHEGLLFIDIDDFKDVNDSLGHEGGDALLAQLAERLRASVRSHDLVARLGGDEFAVVVLDNDDGTPATGPVAERIYEALSEPFVIGDRSLRVSLSMGVAQRTAETADVTELLRQADSAMYRAKQGGKARYEIHGGSTPVVEPVDTVGG